MQIDRGKTLIVRQTGRSEGTDDEGRVKLFFELNGQPRTVRVAKAGAASVRRRPQVRDGDPSQIGAPMSGVVVTVAVSVGQTVCKGQALLSIEAMKMETVLTAARDGVVAALHVAPGERIEAADLLLELS